MRHTEDFRIGRSHRHPFQNHKISVRDDATGEEIYYLTASGVMPCPQVGDNISFVEEKITENENKAVFSDETQVPEKSDQYYNIKRICYDYILTSSPLQEFRAGITCITTLFVAVPG